MRVLGIEPRLLEEHTALLATEPALITIVLNFVLLGEKLCFPCMLHAMCLQWLLQLWEMTVSENWVDSRFLKKTDEPSVLFPNEQICWLTCHIISNFGIIQAKGFLHCQEAPWLLFLPSFPFRYEKPNFIPLKMQWGGEWAGQIASVIFS